MDREDLISLDTAQRVWERIPVVAPLVVVSTWEGGGFDLALKRMASPGEEGQLPRDRSRGAEAHPRYAALGLFASQAVCDDSRDAGVSVFGGG